jgi:hypothetical protein
MLIHDFINQKAREKAAGELNIWTYKAMYEWYMIYSPIIVRDFDLRKASKLAKKAGKVNAKQNYRAICSKLRKEKRDYLPF